MTDLIDTLAGNYRLVARLGAGGMGEVYKAVHATIGSRVAIKVLHATSDPDSEERFLREAKAVNLIEHDGVIKVLDAGRLANGRPYMVMELLEGSSLAELQRAGSISIVDACLVMADVLDALAAAHAAHVIHRDLKPANIFRTRAGRTVVLDFGIAKLVAADGPARLTMTGSAIGTPAYMAPEQITDRDVGPAADLYAAGVVLYELVCGRLPFDGSTVEILNGHLDQPPPPPRALRPELSLALADVMMKALHKEPAGRFGSAAAMRDALRVAMTGALAGPQATRRDELASTSPQTAVERPRAGSSPVTEHVPDATVDLARRGAGPPAPDAPEPPRKPSRRWYAGAPAIVIAMVVGLVIVNRGPRAKQAAPASGAKLGVVDAATQVSDAELGDALASGSDAVALDATTIPVRPIDEQARHAAMQLPSLRNRQVAPCLASVVGGDDVYRTTLARYRNALACKHLAGDDKRTRSLAEAEDFAAGGDPTTAIRLIEKQRALVEATAIDRAFVAARLQRVRSLQGDRRVSDATRDRMAELLRDAAAELAAGRPESANIALDEAAAVAWKSIKLRGG